MSNGQEWIGRILLTNEDGLYDEDTGGKVLNLNYCDGSELDETKYPLLADKLVGAATLPLMDAPTNSPSPYKIISDLYWYQIGDTLKSNDIRLVGESGEVENNLLYCDGSTVDGGIYPLLYDTLPKTDSVYLKDDITPYSFHAPLTSDTSAVGGSTSWGGSFENDYAVIVTSQGGMVFSLDTPLDTSSGFTFWMRVDPDTTSSAGVFTLSRGAANTSNNAMVSYVINDDFYLINPSQANTKREILWNGVAAADVIIQYIPADNKVYVYFIEDGVLNLKASQTPPTSWETPLERVILGDTIFASGSTIRIRNVGIVDQVLDIQDMITSDVYLPLVDPQTVPPTKIVADLT